ncbi:MAG: hypothetical protein ACLUJG_07585 [Lawsonibacter sp.]
MKRESPEEQRKQMLEAPYIPGLIGRLAVPTIISMLVTSIYNMADTYFVSPTHRRGGWSHQRLQAVSIVFSLMAIVQAVGFTVGMGSGSIAPPGCWGRDGKSGRTSTHPAPSFWDWCWGCCSSRLLRLNR